MRVKTNPLVIAVALLGLAGCLASESDTPATSGREPSPTPSASPTPSPEPTSISPSESIGPPETPPPGTPVTPEIFLTTVDVDEGLLRVVVVVPGIFENGGRCVVKVVGTSSTILKEERGEADVSSTACGQFEFSLAQLGSGKANVTANYESSDHAGSSIAVEVEIP